MYVLFNDTATTEIYTLSLHDALPISEVREQLDAIAGAPVDPHLAERVFERSEGNAFLAEELMGADRKSTRLNSSHANISYAVFCLKKKNECRAAGPSSLLLSLGPAHT